ncbi:MAG: LysE family transporter [Saprospiraceae bacterium]
MKQWCENPCYKTKIYQVEFILEGIVLGITLATLLGPIFVILIETSMRYGARAGLAVGSGIWFSDILFILAAYFFIHKIQEYVVDSSFQYWIGNLGGFILLTMGLAKLFKSKTHIPMTSETRFSRHVGFFGKGFMVNTFNPFTFVFWFGVIGSKMVDVRTEENNVLIMCLTILTIIVLTDSAKVLGAKWISKRMKESIMDKVNVVAAILLILGGILLVGKTSF